MEKISEVYNENNMIGMARYPDKFFDLAVVDPEYGINISNQKSFGKRKNTVLTTNYESKKWDAQLPDKKYFDELFRISKNQIIWGGNYFIEFLQNTRCFLLWDKGYNAKVSFSDFEIAWTSFNRNCEKIRIPFNLWRNCISTDRRSALQNSYRKIHQAQKPVALYDWILLNFAEPGNKIIDTHMGSQSSRISAFKLGFDYWGWEIDKYYFEEGNKRFSTQISQQQLF